MGRGAHGDPVRAVPGRGWYRGALTIGYDLATGSDDRTVRLWDVADGKIRATLTGHTGGVASVAFSPGGRTLASASDDRTVRLWDEAIGQTRATLTGHTESVRSVAFSPERAHPRYWQR